MSVLNPWLNPFQRSYQQIKDKLIEDMRMKLPELTDFSEGNIFIVLISMFAAIAEVLHYYIDNMSRETFFSTARRYSSLVKHAKMVDYHIKCGIPSMVDLVVSRVDGYPIAASVEIPVNTEFMGNNGYTYLSTKTVIWQKDTYGVSVPIAQKEFRDGNTGQGISFDNLTSQDIIIQLGDLGSGVYYVEGSMTLYITDRGIRTTWTLVDTFAYSKPDSKHYKVEMDDSQKPYVKFGDGTFGMKPPLGSSIIGSFYVTYGSNGNTETNTITSVPSNITQIVGEVQVTNPYPSVGGTNYEDFDMLKDHVPLSIKTLGVAITKQDYEDVTKLTPGVDKAYVDYICGKFINIYITPDGGGVAPTALLDKALQEVLKRKVITTNVKVLPTGISEIYLNANITGKKSFRASNINDQVTNALIQAYNYNSSDIGKPVRLSDLYALIDNLSMVDYLTMVNLYLKPWPTKLGNTASSLNITYFNAESVKQKKTYILNYQQNGSNPDVKITSKETGLDVSIAPIGGLVKVIDGETQFTIRIGNPLTGAYSNNEAWSIIVLPNNVDQDSVDFTIPVFLNKSSINLTINEVV